MNHSLAEHGLIPTNPVYPMLRGGGAFLVCIGLGLVCAIAFSGLALINYNVFFAGVGAGVVALFVSKRRARIRPTPLQVRAVAGAVLLEVALFVTMGNTLPPGTTEHIRWLWALVIVGVHFLPMSLAFGPRFLALGLLCIGNAALGLLAANTPYELFGFVDGGLKIGFGVWSLTAKK